MELSSPVTALGGIGEKTAKLLKKLDVHSVRELLYFLPRTYKDMTNVQTIGAAKLEETALFCVTIDTQPTTARIRKGLEITTFQVSDDTGVLKVSIFNQVYIKQYLHQGKKIYLYGKMECKRKICEISAPEILFKKPEHPYLPIYPLTAGLKQHTLQKAVLEALQKVNMKELYSPEFLEKFMLEPIDKAIWHIHFPKNTEQAKRARTRLVFDELLIFSRMIGLLNEEKAERNRTPVGMVNRAEFLERFSFRPTGAQLKVMDEIEADMKGSFVMNRMVQGDVGSGKTMVALYAMFCMYQNGYSSVMMAPTEILAEQHYRSACAVFPEEDIVFLSGSQTVRQRKSQAKKMEDKAPKVIIGTHALIYGALESEKIGLIITDEQHRFGVKQRAQLAAGSHDMHTLIMSATPIPRSLALVLYGKTKISIIDELPPGRKPVKTYLIHKNKYRTMFDFVRGEVVAGRQAYIVCPLIEDSEMLQARSAQDVFAELQEKFPGISMGLLHGKLKNDAKKSIMSEFAQGEMKILVSTTVIEVGVDVSNANVMVVMNAERFGLAQLHQLRGRVGRGEWQSYCFLVSDMKEAYDRLRVLVRTNDGFEIAEQDMRLRGAGDVFGTRQHGVGSLKIANLIEDSRQLDKAGKVLEVMKQEKQYQQEYTALTKRAMAIMKNDMVEIAFN